MKIIIIDEETETSCEAAQASAENVEDLTQLFRQAMLGAGFHPHNVEAISYDGEAEEIIQHLRDENADLQSQIDELKPHTVCCRAPITRSDLIPAEYTDGARLEASEAHRAPAIAPLTAENF